MERIEKLTLDGKNILCFNLTDITNNKEVKQLIEAAEEEIAKYPENSVYTITDVENMLYDTLTKEIVSEWMVFNTPYVICGAITGLDGIKKIMVNAVLKISKRTNMKTFKKRKQATEWISSL